MLYIESMFVPRLSSRVKRFRQIKPYTWNFACSICGDQSKGRQKYRAYVYPMKGFLGYKCHHCGASMSFGNFLKMEHPDLYKEFVLERYKEASSSHIPHTNPKEVMDISKVSNNEGTFFDGLERCSELSPDHSAVKFLNDRQIPKQFWDDLWYCEYIKEFSNSVAPGTFKKVSYDHPRVVIPYKNQKGEVVAFTARALGNEEPKYLMVKLDEHAERIYGIDRLDYGKTIYVTEGAIDSMFLPNAIAISGASYNTPFLQELMDQGHRFVIVPDNEPRNREVCANIKNAIKLNYNISLLPGTIKQKDINDMIKAGYPPNVIVDTIEENVAHGLTAMMKYNAWTKVSTKRTMNEENKTKNANSYRELNSLLSGGS